MLTDTIKKQLIEAMKAKDTQRVSTLRLLSSTIQNVKIDKKDDLTDEEVLDIIRSEVKKRKDAIEAFEKAGREEQAEAEKQEMALLQEYLPTNLTEEEIEKLINEAITETKSQTQADMGRVMGVVMAKAKGRADGNDVRKMVEAKLQS